jgi:hypothetical protein
MIMSPHDPGLRIISVGEKQMKAEMTPDRLMGVPRKRTIPLTVMGVVAKF